MKKNENTKRIATGFLWSFFEKIGAQGVTFVVSVILARLLEPSIYGIVAIVNIIISVLQVFVEKGLGSALVQKKDADNLDFSSFFYFNIAFSIILYILTFFLAPFIAKFYVMPELTGLIRVSGISLIIASVKNILYSYVEKNLLFKRFFFATLGGTIGAAVVGIALAYSGYGVWALVIQSLLNTLVDTIILWFTVKWKPMKAFSLTRVKELYKYGWKILTACLLDTVYSRLRQLIIGKKYTSEDLAFYNRGDAYPGLIVNNLNGALNNILFPSMSSIQDDLAAVKNMLIRSIKVSTYISFPLMVGFSVTAEPIIQIVLTDKWLPIVPYLRISCFIYATISLQTANTNAIKALGRSDLFLKIGIVEKAVGIAAIIVSMWFGVLAIAYSAAFVAFVSVIIDAYPNRKLINCTIKEQIKSILPNLAISGLMGIIVYFIVYLGLNKWATLVIQIITGAVVYIVLSYILKIESFNYLLNLTKSFVKKD